MAESNRTYRIRTDVGKPNAEDIRLDVSMLQDYDIFEILSLKIGTENVYKLHSSKYGCVVGRVLANGGVGVPNAKLSVFVPLSEEDSADHILQYIYPYSSTVTKDNDGIRYNLLPKEQIDACHTNVGTFPDKRLVLDDDTIIEVFDKYYKFTTTTNGSGDYMIFGLPVGQNTIHMDVDLSDIGILSQRPRDFFYKGYNVNQFENASQFKGSNNLDSLPQIISQDNSVYVNSFWGDESEGQISITRLDIDVNYKFEPTCIFLGCIVSDERSNAISKNCIPHERMGRMDRLTTGNGTIEMIRKTVSNGTESIAIQGNQLIDGNGIWCYQIPMNLDYVATDEYGNMVPTDNTERGIPTRTSVRFRISLADYESDYESAHLVKVLVPNNPQIKTENGQKKLTYDYEFGSQTLDESYRDLFWNDVYTVKQYVPRFQKGNFQRNKNFTGFKAVNVNGSNNPIPYNNLRVELTFLFVFQCLIFKALYFIVKLLNKIIKILDRFSSMGCRIEGLTYITIDAGICPALDGNFMAPGASNDGAVVGGDENTIIPQTYKSAFGDEISIGGEEEGEGGDTSAGGTVGNVTIQDNHSADNKNNPSSGSTYVNDNGTNKLDTGTEHRLIFNEDGYFIKCVELQFAMEYEVIQFDFYNDWINGMLYIPRWNAEIRRNRNKVYHCGDTFHGNRVFVQQCAIPYTSEGTMSPNYQFGCYNDEYQKCHRYSGRKRFSLQCFKPYDSRTPWTGRGGIVEHMMTSKGHTVYYLRPTELLNREGDKTLVKCNLFATDIVLLGSVLDCNEYGIPKVIGYPSSTYRMPPPTAEIVSDSQEMSFQGMYNPIIGGLTGSTSNAYMYVFHGFKKTILSALDKGNEAQSIEMSGIDWGYNPFSNDANDDTSILSNQVAGHFLEIGCVFSLTNVKSCVNLSRVCELGGETSQSHYYNNPSNDTWEMVKTSGFISRREIVNSGLRATFSALNSNALGTAYDNDSSYLKYKFTPYIPTNFLGEFSKSEINKAGDANFNAFKSIYGVIENQSESYKIFRFGSKDLFDKFMVQDYKKDFYIPMYNNSFYFYFGLRDGNTAIDKLYKEYYAECVIPETKLKRPKMVLSSNSLMSSESNLSGNIAFNNKIYYFIEDFDFISACEVYKYADTTNKWNKVSNGESGFVLYQDKGYIKVSSGGTYKVIFRDIIGRMVQGTITVSGNQEIHSGISL